MAQAFCRATKMPSRTVKLGMLLSCAGTLALLATVVPSQGQDGNQKGLKSERKNVMTMKDDLANRATAIYWARWIRSRYGRSVFTQCPPHWCILRACVASHRRGDQVAGMVSQLEGRSDRRRDADSTSALCQIRKSRRHHNDGNAGRFFLDFDLRRPVSVLIALRNPSQHSKPEIVTAMHQGFIGFAQVLCVLPFANLIGHHQTATALRLQVPGVIKGRRTSRARSRTSRCGCRERTR